MSLRTRFKNATKGWRAVKIAAQWQHRTARGKTISVNLWDDDPPGTHAYVEGHDDDDRHELVLDVWDRTEVLSLIRDVVIKAGYRVYAKDFVEDREVLDWDKERGITKEMQNLIKRPTLYIEDPNFPGMGVMEPRPPWSDAGHSNFLEALLPAITNANLKWKGIPLSVYSES